MSKKRNGSRKSGHSAGNRRRTKPRVAYEAHDGPIPPPGAVAADRSQQVPWNSYGPAPEYYVDKPFTCVDCGAEQVWTAAQQKWYYEVAKGPLYATAIRCRTCRQKRRQTGNLENGSSVDQRPAQSRGKDTTRGV